MDSGCIGRPGKKPKLPATLGACADLLYQIRLDKAKAQKVVDDLQAHARALEEHLISKLSVDDAEGVVGKVAKVVILPEVHPTVEADKWSLVYDYIRKHKAFELLQKRLNTKAVKERWEAGKAIPGVTKFHDKKVSLTKR